MKKSFISSLKLFCIVSFSFYSASCNSNSTPGNIPDLFAQSNIRVQDYYPLNQGRSWTYKLEQFQDGIPNNKFTEMTMKVSSENHGDSFSTAIIEREYPGSSVTPNPSLAKIYPDKIELSRYNPQILNESFNNNQLKSSSIVILQAPLSIGNNWPGRVFQGGTETISIIAGEDVTVPAGSFNALKIGHKIKYDNGREDNLYYWYAKNIGTVKMYEEISLYLNGKWMKLSSSGLLKAYSK